jgi:hypothetical protein
MRLCDPFASVLRSIEETTAGLTCCAFRFAVPLDAKAAMTICDTRLFRGQRRGMPMKLMNAVRRRGLLSQ